MIHMNSAKFDFLVDPGTASADDIAKLFVALSDLARACGGGGLDFDVEEAQETADGRTIVKVSARPRSQ